MITYVLILFLASQPGTELYARRVGNGDVIHYATLEKCLHELEQQRPLLIEKFGDDYAALLCKRVVK